MRDQSQSRIERVQFIVRAVIPVGVSLGLLFAAFVGPIGYVNYLHDEGREQACDEQFGASSDWTGNSVSDNGVICETPGGDLKRIEDVSSLPISPDTFASYLGTYRGVLP